MLDVRPAGLPGVVEIRPVKAGDERGFFSETWSAQAMAEAGMELVFVQDNHSRSAAQVLRGLHYQLPPFAQDKLVRVSRGAVFDVAVDIRKDSPTFGRWTSAVLSAEHWNQLLIPRGLAHGFLALAEGTEVQYKVTAPYRPELERSIRFDDPAIGIEWPVPAAEILLSAKDRAAPPLAEADIPDHWS
jgi:dTDP-4-dehydrorhamnose 3,5-epimerase